MGTPLSEKAPLNDSSSPSYLTPSFTCTHECARAHTHTHSRNKDKYTGMQTQIHFKNIIYTCSGTQASIPSTEHPELTFDINCQEMSHLQEAKQEL